jgi:transcriptional regulator with XRE-family HTH domain
MNQFELAYKTGFHVNTIKDIERGKSEGSPESRQTIAQALGCTVSDLYSGGGVETKWTEMSTRDLARLYLQATEENARLQTENSELLQHKMELKRIKALPYWRAYESAEPQLRLDMLKSVQFLSDAHALSEKAKPRRGSKES